MTASGFGTIGALLFSSLLALFALLWAFRLSQPLEQQWMPSAIAEAASQVPWMVIAMSMNSRPLGTLRLTAGIPST